jgi:hypothetical protein
VDVSKDAAELFLDPGKSKKAYFQFCASPLGARSDMRVTPCGKRETGLYTPDWDAAPHIGAGHWALEIRIPLGELVFDGGFIGTPQPGDEWGINFCRDQGRFKEWSLWSPHKDKSFHRPAQFGTAVFRGRKDGKNPPRVSWSPGAALDYGPVGLSLTAEPAEGLLCDWTVLHDLRPAECGAGRDLTLKLSPASGGEWDVRARVKKDGSEIFFGRGKNKLPPVRELVSRVYERVTSFEKTAASGQSAAVSGEMKKQAAELKDMAAPLYESLKNPGALSRAQWRDTADKLPEIEAKWRPLEYSLETLRFRRPDDPGSFAVSHTGPAERVYMDTVIPPRDKPAELWAAGGETESFQLLVMPFVGDVKNLTVSFSDLKGDPGVIPASCFEHKITGFVKMHEAWGGKWTPDPLYPGRPFDLHGSRTQPVWVDLTVPRRAAPGVYEGAATVSGGGHSVTVPIRLNVFGFDIPERRSVSADPWYWPEEKNWLDYYKVKEIPFTPELYEKHLKTLSKYRYGCYPLETSVMWGMLKIYQEKDGSLSFDFSGWDWVFEMGRKYGADNLGASFGCNFNSLRPSCSPQTPVYDRATGAKIANAADYALKKSGWKYTRGETKKSDFAENPVYRQYIAQLTDYLDKKGLLQKSHYEIYDEPKTGDEWRDLIRMHSFLKSFVPGLKLKSYGVGPWTFSDIISPIGRYDVWAPGLYTLTPERLDILRGRQAKGEEFWFYTCSAGYRDSDRKSKPHICLYQHPLAPRMHGWAAWKLGADGFLVFALMAGHPDNTQPDASKFYTEPVWHDTPNSTQGSLVYPGPGFEMIPSMRLAALRDGLEDYEYFKVLSERLKLLNPEKDAPLIKEIEDALKVTDDIIPWDWFGWTQDIEKLNSKRRALAGLIARADQTAGESR